MLNKQLLPARFTKREREVITLFGQGLTAEQVSERLGLAIHTAHHHIKYAKKKVKARNITHLVAIAIKDRLIDVSKLEEVA